MQDNITFNFDDVNAMQEHAERLRNKAKRLVEEGRHAQAADCIEIANCARVIQGLVMRMSHLLSKCPCCYEQITMN